MIQKNLQFTQTDVPLERQEEDFRDTVTHVVHV